ncbi:uncharacterized protein LOC115329322 [Ixodes scapularis]|uniref:uncharacterized protein LOC115329322 n=1 Tax=Ixodes scapularis TaxID=6945 RepID=UPI001A9E116B|nr:uncharacterized protein LOC115329322 [Ixodes scapularis]
MIVLVFLGIPLLSHCDTILPKESGGDYPDANEVMKKLPETYMLQSLLNFANLTCGYQKFYNRTKRNKTFGMYAFFHLYMDGHFHYQPYYVKIVTNYTVHMGTHRKKSYPPTTAREVLFSNMESCMVIKNPRYTKACNLMVNREGFMDPPIRCLRKFEEHCKGPVFNYTIDDCPYPKSEL